MKLKFKVEKKDFIIFGIFAVFLFYLSCVAVLNISSFASEGTLAGINPFPALSRDYFPLTMIVFIGALIAIITSVSSTIFSKEKGFGFELGKKKDKGYSRWATDKEMKKELVQIDPMAYENDAGGIPIIMNKKGVWVDNGDYHSLIIGSTGAGKTQTTVFPMVKNLSKHNESMIITDPKGEIYEDTAEMLKERGYKIVILNFRNPQQGNSWNPLSLPYQLYKEGNPDKATELLDDLALNILYDESAKNQDPFWEKTSADYFAGIAQALFEDAREDQINLNSINLMTTVGEDKIMGSTYIKEYFNFKDPTSAAFINVSSTINAPNETKGSILSVFRQKIKLFATRENLSEMLSHSDFDMKDIGRQKTAVFLVIQDEKKTYHSLVTIFLKQCYETLIAVAQESGGKLPHRTNFILDEFANMPPLKDVTTMVTAARSRNIRFNFIIQNFAQLYDVYGKENGETIKGNCGNIVYLISSELSALEEISKMAGEEKSKDGEKTVSTPLVTVSDLQRLKQWDIIVLRIRMMPFKTTLTPNFQMNWGKTYPKATFPQRKKEPVKTFDIKKFVDEKRQEKMRDMLGDNSKNPGMRMPDLPFPNMGMPNRNPFERAPFPGMPSNPAFPPSTPDNNFDVDELIKRIDAKIAELEEEERLEKEQSKNRPIIEPIKEEDDLQDKIIPTLPPKRVEVPKIEESNIHQETEESMNSLEDILPDSNEHTVVPKVDETPSNNHNVVSKVDEIPSNNHNVIPKVDEIPSNNHNVIQKVDEIPSNTVNEANINLPTVPIYNDDAIYSDTYITDDQFFDDFFYDEDE